MTASYLRDSGELTEPFPLRELAPGVRTGLAHDMSCAGWEVSSSPTAILAERGRQARWLFIESASGIRRFMGVRCDRGRVKVARWGSLATFSDPKSFARQLDTLELDLERGIAHSRPATPRP